jgi:hypothetical protein
MKTGRAIAQAVSCRRFVAEARVRSQLSSCGIRGGKSGTGESFVVSPLVSFPVALFPGMDSWPVSGDTVLL